MDVDTDRQQRVRVAGPTGEPRNDAVALIRDRLQRVHVGGDLSPGADAGLLARYLVTVSNGIEVQAGDGVGADELRRIADLALRAWSAD